MAFTHKEAVVRKDNDISEIKEKMEKATIAILTDYRGDQGGLTVKDITTLRRRLRETDSEYRVYKNTLCRKAVKETGAKDLADHFKDPTAIVFGFKDSASTSKVLVEFIKEQKKERKDRIPLPIIKVAYMDGAIYDEKQVEVLATLPSREELLAQVLRTMNAPTQNFVNVLAAVPRSLLNVLNAIKDQKAEA